MNDFLDANVSFPEVAAELDRIRWIDPDQNTYNLYQEAWVKSGVDTLCITLGAQYGGDSVFNIYNHKKIPEMWSFASALRHIQIYTIKFEETYKDIL
jgi:hypothetical protein